MIDSIAAHPGAAAWILGGLAALLVALLCVWLWSVRNTRLLSLELDQADREIHSLDSRVADQAARLRIVQELHEVAVQQIQGIIRQADGSRYVIDTDPAAATRSATLIAEAARTTLADLRRITTVAASGAALFAPRPSIRSIDELVSSMEGVGLTIAFAETGTRFDLPTGADAAIYRILEEALSNALSYGGPGTDVRVSFAWTADGVQLLVDDDGVQAEARRDGIAPGDVSQQRTYTFQDDLDALTEVVSGSGVSEMRQRTVAFGGVFNAYSVPGVGFSVSAIFPALRHDNAVHGVDLSR